jgi:hypothetical protein
MGLIAQLKIDVLQQLEFFLDNPDSPEPDLCILPILQTLDEAAMNKWDELIASFPITGFAESDVHQNAFADPMCAEGGEYKTYCDLFEPQIPKLVAHLRVGGPLLLSDGQRIDAYERVFRWFANYVIIRGDNEPLEIREAIRNGNLFFVFDVLGTASGFDFFAETDGKTYEMGSQISWTDTLNLHMRTPELTTPVWAKQPFEDTPSSPVRTVIVRIDENGKSIIFETSGQKKEITFRVESPGSYYVQVYIKPLHLIKGLKNLQPYAESEYLWVISNPIYVK